MFAQSALSLAAWTFLSCVPAVAQTFTNCNPRFASCPPDTALGKSINIDFTKGSVNSFTTSGNPTYDSSGAHFTISKSGDAPTLTSLFYIMFGKVSVTMKAAPGAGIVSSFILQSDDLDEIDLEWLGADDSEVQTNYFGKGDTSTYDRGAFNPAANNQDQFITYTIEWTAQQVTWSIGGTVVRVLTPATADANQYPQTPMQIKFGAWSGGDPSTNSPGTVQWARGPTDYSKGPFTMTVRSIAISDYSTGTSYKYSGSSGNWQDIIAVGGAVNGNIGAANTAVATAQVPSATSASPTIPIGGFGSSSSNPGQTGWPWVASATTLTTAVATSSIAGIPSGWTVSSSGKIIPVSTAATSLTSLSSSPPSSSPSSSLSVASLDTTTTTLPTGSQTMSKCFDGQGFQVQCGLPSTTAATTVGSTTKQPSQVLGAVTVAPTSASQGNSVAQSKLVMPIWGTVAIILATLLY